MEEKIIRIAEFYIIRITTQLLAIVIVLPDVNIVITHSLMSNEYDFVDLLRHNMRSTNFVVLKDDPYLITHSEV